MNKKVILTMPLLFAVAFFFLSACGNEQKDDPVVLQGETMGTYWRVSLAEKDVSPKAEENLQVAIKQVLLAVNQSMSTYIDDSELMLFNRQKTDQYIPISDEMRKVVAQALKVSKESDGYYDVTVGPLVDEWGFGPTKITKSPSKPLIEKLLASTGYEHLFLNSEGLRKDLPDISIDLSSIAKGYGVDAVAELIENAGYHNYIVDIGGEIDIKGRKFDNDWKVGIEVPEENKEDIETVIDVKQPKLSMATSGNYRNYADYDGVKAVHTINPKTGYPELSKLLSVTVVAENCMTADAYATALMVMGDEKAKEFAEKYDLAVLYIFAGNEKDEFKVDVSTGYQRLMEE